MKTINTNNLKAGDIFYCHGLEWKATKKEPIGIMAKPTNKEVLRKIYEDNETLFVSAYKKTSDVENIFVSRTVEVREEENTREPLPEKGFKPAMNIKEKVKDYLLKGYAVKFDGGATNTILIIPRGQLNHTEVTFTQMSNLSRGSEIPGAVTLPRCDVWEVLKELAAEGYSVLSKECHSGCCQYHTNVKYLAEDQG